MIIADALHFSKRGNWKKAVFTSNFGVGMKRKVELSDHFFEHLKDFSKFQTSFFLRHHEVWQEHLSVQENADFEMFIT